MLLANTYGGVLVLAASRPGMGKTAFVTNIVRRTAGDLGRPLGLLLAGSATEVFARRLLAAFASIPLRRLCRAHLEDQEKKRLRRALKTVAALPLHVMETPGFSPEEIRAAAEQLKARDNVAAIVVDHLETWWEHNEMVTSSRADGIITVLKEIACDLDMPILATVNVACPWTPRQARNYARNGFFAQALCRMESVTRCADILSVIDCEDAYHMAEPNYTATGLTTFLIARNSLGPTGLVNVAMDPDLCLFVAPDP